MVLRNEAVFAEEGFCSYSESRAIQSRVFAAVDAVTRSRQSPGNEVEAEIELSSCGVYVSKSRVGMRVVEMPLSTKGEILDG